MHPLVGVDRGVRVALGGSQHDPGADHHPMLCSSRGGSSRQDGILGGGQDDRAAGRDHHASVVADLHPGTSADTPQSSWFLTRWATIRTMVKIPESTQTSLRQRLSARARERWPGLVEVKVRYRAGFAYIDGALADGEVLKLCRLRYAGSASQCGFAIYRASHDDYEDSFLPTGSMGGTAEDALDTACGLYLDDPTAWT